MSVGARGLRPWLLQRFTAVYLGLFLVTAILGLAWAGPDSYEDWRSCLANPFVNLFSALFFVALFLHAWVGVRDVIMDYISGTGLRVVLLGAVAFVLLACALWASRVLLLAATGMSA